MQNNNHILLYLLLLLLSPSVAAQDSFMGNSGEHFAPSTIIIIIMAVIFMFTGLLSVFLRQFSAGCFGLNVTPINPAVTADGLPAERGLDAEAIKSLPTYFYSDVKQHRKGKVELECAVCLSEFQDPEALRLLPGCSHVFHPRCIDQWLASHVTCPVCRQSLEPGSDTTKPHSIINLPLTQDESDVPDHATLLHDDHLSDDEGEKKQAIIGKFPRSHSTGHSLANSERFTLILPEEVVQSDLVNRRRTGSEVLTSILSPRIGYRCGWLSTGSVRSMVPSGSKNLPLPPVRTSDRLWPI